jgi:hypothetical protein
LIRKRLRDWFWAQAELFRKTRMRAFVRVFQPTPTMRILDIGGTDLNWRIIDQPARVVLLNTKMPEGGYDLGLLGSEYSDARTDRPPAAGPPRNVAYELGDGKSVPILMANSISVLQLDDRAPVSPRRATEIRERSTLRRARCLAADTCSQLPV